jgi:diketogulonate reductase-like aldo/keto reductase
MAYAPLGKLGNLTAEQPSILKNEVIASIAKKHNKTPVQVALRYEFFGFYFMCIDGIYKELSILLLFQNLFMLKE